MLTSSGFLLRPGTPPELQSFIDGALRWNITVHAIGAQGLEARMTGRKDMVRTAPYLMPLENITNGTGGHYFKDSNDLAGAMQMATDPEASYQVAFHAADPDGKFHTLKIRFLARRGEDLQYRPGYFSPDPKKQTSARAGMDDAVFSKEALREIPTSVALSTADLKDGSLPISVKVSVDLKNVEFTRLNGRHMQQIVFLTTLLDSKGGFVTGKESIMDMALTDEKLASMRNDGLKAVTTLNAPPGVVRCAPSSARGSRARSARLRRRWKYGQSRIRPRTAASFQGPGFLGKEVRYTSVFHVSTLISQRRVPHRPGHYRRYCTNAGARSADSLRRHRHRVQHLQPPEDPHE